MRWLQELKRALNTRDRHQWLGIRHQFNALHHDRKQADDALREAHAEFNAGDRSEDGFLEDAELDLEAAAVQARRAAAIQREHTRRRHIHRRKNA